MKDSSELIHLPNGHCRLIELLKRQFKSSLWSNNVFFCLSLFLKQVFLRQVLRYVITFIFFVLSLSIYLKNILWNYSVLRHLNNKKSSLFSFHFPLSFFELIHLQLFNLLLYLNQLILLIRSITLYKFLLSRTRWLDKDLQSKTFPQRTKDIRILN
jgi:hypothetical protein